MPDAKPPWSLLTQISSSRVTKSEQQLLGGRQVTREGGVKGSGSPQQLPSSMKSRVSYCSQAGSLSSSWQSHSKHSSSPPASLRDIADTTPNCSITLEGPSQKSTWPPAPRSLGPGPKGHALGHALGRLARRSVSRATRQHHRQDPLGVAPRSPEEGGAGTTPAGVVALLGAARSGRSQASHTGPQPSPPPGLLLMFSPLGTAAVVASCKSDSGCTGKYQPGLEQVHLPKGGAWRRCAWAELPHSPDGTSCGRAWEAISRTTLPVPNLPHPSSFDRNRLHFFLY